MLLLPGFPTRSEAIALSASSLGTPERTRMSISVSPFRAVTTRLAVVREAGVRSASRASWGSNRVRMGIVLLTLRAAERAGGAAVVCSAGARFMIPMMLGAASRGRDGPRARDRASVATAAVLDDERMEKVVPVSTMTVPTSAARATVLPNDIELAPVTSVPRPARPSVLSSPAMSGAYVRRPCSNRARSAGGAACVRRKTGLTATATALRRGLSPSGAE